MSSTQRHERSFATFTVSDMLLFVAACSISALIVRHARPAGLIRLKDYLMVAAYCGPAGVAMFGPWAVRRQFTDARREELFAGEWLWVVLGAGWLLAAPLILFVDPQTSRFSTLLLAASIAAPTTVALILSVAPMRRRPWTHWIGLAVCLAQAVPLLFDLGPFFTTAFERIYWFWSKELIPFIRQ